MTRLVGMLKYSTALMALHAIAANSGSLTHGGGEQEGHDVAFALVVRAHD